MKNKSRGGAMCDLIWGATIFSKKKELSESLYPTAHTKPQKERIRKAWKNLFLI